MNQNLLAQNHKLVFKTMDRKRFSLSKSMFCMNVLSTSPLMSRQILLAIWLECILFLGKKFSNKHFTSSICTSSISKLYTMLNITIKAEC